MITFGNKETHSGNKVIVLQQGKTQFNMAYIEKNHNYKLYQTYYNKKHGRNIHKAKKHIKSILLKHMISIRIHKNN